MEVFFTTLVIERLLEKRESHHVKEKLNMLVGVFYAEIGTQLLSYFVEQDDNVYVCKNYVFKILPFGMKITLNDYKN